MEQVLKLILAKQGYDIIGIIDNDKKILGYAKDNVFHFCNEHLEEIDRKEIGIKDEIVALSQLNDNITILKDGSKFNYQLCFFIDENNEILGKYYDRWGDGNSQICLNRIDSKSVYLYKDIDEIRIYKDSESYIFPHRFDFGFSSSSYPAIIDGIYYTENILGLKKIQNDYYLLQYREKCKIYKPNEGVVFEDAHFYIWRHNNQINLVDGKEIVKGDRIVGYVISLLSLDGKELVNFNVYDYVMRDKWRDLWCDIFYERYTPKYFENCIIFPLPKIGFFLIRYFDPDKNDEGKFIPINWEGKDYYNLGNHLISICSNNATSIYDFDGNCLVLEGSSHILRKIEPFGRFEGIMETSDFKIVIPPVFERIGYYGDYFYEATLPIKMGNAPNIKGLLSFGGELIIPFGMKYHFAKYNFTLYNELISSQSNEYIIFEEGSHKGLIYKDKKVLDAVYDEFEYPNFELDLPVNMSDKAKNSFRKILKQEINCVFLNKDGKWGYYIDEECFLSPRFSYIKWFTIKDGYHYFIGVASEENKGSYLFSEDKEFNIRCPYKDEPFDSISVVGKSDLLLVRRNDCVGLAGTGDRVSIYIPPTYQKISRIFYSAFIADNVLRDYENIILFDLKDEFEYMATFNSIYAFKSKYTKKYVFIGLDGALEDIYERKDGIYEVSSDLFFNPEENVFFEEKDDDQQDYDASESDWEEWERWYAQNEGYRDAFDGDPEAQWNID